MSRPLRTTAEHQRREAAQSRKVKARDKVNGKPFCWLEKYNEKTKTWKPCGKSGNMDTVHILRRNQCGEVWDHEDVALTGCRECHNELDNNLIGTSQYRVRVPYDRALTAWNLVVANTKIRPYMRYNPDHNMDYADVHATKNTVSNG